MSFESAGHAEAEGYKDKERGDDAVEAQPVHDCGKNGCHGGVSRQLVPKGEEKDDPEDKEEGHTEYPELEILLPLPEEPVPTCHEICTPYFR